MSTNDSGGPRRFSRREFLGLGAGAGLLASAGYVGMAGAAPPQQASHRGVGFRVERLNGREELFIDGKRIKTVKNNGAYRAANFMFSPSPNLEDLARKMIDHQLALQQRKGLGG